MEKLYTFNLVDIKQETDDIKSFVFSPPEDFVWQAGQYLDWQVPHDNADERGERRWFSIASAPSEGVVMLSCRFSEDGSTLKKHLLSLEVGDKLEAKGPMGEFTLQDVTKKTVLIAGGIGITPFRSIIKDLASREELQNVVLIYGNRSPENVPFESEIKQIQLDNPGFSCHFTFSPTTINAELISNLTGEFGDTTFMISGLEKMVESIRESLIEAGVSEQNVRIDDFGGYDWHLEKPIY